MLAAFAASRGPRYWIIRVISADVCGSGVCQSVGTAPSLNRYDRLNTHRLLLVFRVLVLVLELWNLR